MEGDSWHSGVTTKARSIIYPADASAMLSFQCLSVKKVRIIKIGKNEINKN